jgi:hypothetical protein
MVDVADPEMIREQAEAATHRWENGTWLLVDLSININSLKNGNFSTTLTPVKSQYL